MMNLGLLDTTTQELVFRPLTREDIDRRLRSIARAVTRVDDLEATSAADLRRPRVITAAELVRRVRPFLSLN